MDNNEQNQQQRPTRTNEEYLKDSLRFLGFGETLFQLLEENLRAKQLVFSMDTTMLHGDKQMDFTLNFKQGKDGDRYFFNNYEAKLTHNNANGSPVQKRQTFYIDKGKAFTAKEAFNLLDGRAVYRDDLSTKENTTYKAWVKLDLEHPTQSGQHKTMPYGEDHGQKNLTSAPNLGNSPYANWMIQNIKNGLSAALNVATFSR